MGTSFVSGTNKLSSFAVDAKDVAAEAAEELAEVTGGGAGQVVRKEWTELVTFIRHR